MNLTNPLHPSLPFLTGSQLVEQAALLDSLHNRALKAIDRLQRDVDARKAAISSRWKTAPLDAKHKRQVEAEEIRVAILEIRKNSERELDAILKEAGAAHARAISQRDFYDSPVKTLNRLTLGDPKRTEYAAQVETVGPAELLHLAQFAVSTSNLPLAAAIVSRLDRMLARERPVGAAALASALQLEEHRKGTESLRIADARLQSILVAIRAWKSGKANPLSTVALGLKARTLDQSVLSEMEADDAAR